MAQGFASVVTSYASALNNVTFPAIKRDRITDQIYDTSPLFALMRGTGHIKEVRGGLFIGEVANIGKSPNSGWYQGQGGFSIKTFEGLIQLGWDWKFAHDAVVITGPEIVMNEGSDDAIVDLIQARIDVSSLSLPDLVAADMYLNNPNGATNIDGSASNANSIESLTVFMDDGTNSTLVGQQSRTTYPSLKAKVNYNSTIGAGMIPAIQAQWLAANRGGRSRTKINFTTELAYGAYWGFLQSPERYAIDPYRLEALGLKTTGGNDLAFNDAVVLLDEKCPTGMQKPVLGGGSGGLWLGMNTDFFEMIVHPDRFFTVGEWFRDPYGDQYYLDVWLAMAFKCMRPNRQFTLWLSGG